jgi:hypothetical protein
MKMAQSLLTAARAALVFASVVVAAPSAGAVDEVLLTITAGDEVRSLTAADLAALPQHRIVTGTEFTDGPTTFSGPLARDVLAPPRGATVVVLSAVNDYSVEAPVEDFRDYDVIMATSMNGTPLSRRDKGPIWLMYPLDDHAELADPVYVNRLIWQLDRVAFR